MTTIELLRRYLVIALTLSIQRQYEHIGRYFQALVSTCFDSHYIVRCTKLVYTVTISLPILVTACGGSDKSDPINSTYIDVNKGSDSTGNGSIGLPYKTITFASQAENRNRNLVLSSGLYSEASGELFPIILPSEVNLRSEENPFTTDTPAIISGSGTFQSQIVNSTQNSALVLSNSSEVSFLVVENSQGSGIWIEGAGSNVTILNNIVQNSQTGIVVAVNGEAGRIQNNLVRDNENAGINLLETSSPLIVRNEIVSNGVGIVVQDASLPKLGLLSGAGTNIISKNRLCNLRHLGSADLEVTGNQWDIDVFQFTVKNECINGENISNESTGAIDYQFIPPTNSPMFPGTLPIPLISPQAGELLFSNQPSFTWTARSRNPTMLVVLESPPINDGDSLSNTEKIHWLWHSGLATGIPGLVTYADGVSIIDGDLTSTKQAEPLTRGRSYYWTIWEWDKDGVSIEASSDVSYFRVLN